MNILNVQKEEANKLGAKYIDSVRVWDFYTHGIPTSNNSNLIRYLTKLFDNSDICNVLVLVGAKGRSRHDATQLNIFDTSNLDNEQLADLTTYSNSNEVEGYQKIDKSHSYYQETGYLFY